MSDQTESRWYDLGHALEQARQHPTRGHLDALVERLLEFRGSGSDGNATGFDRLIDGGVAVVAGRLLAALPSRGRPTLRRVAEGAAFGAAATLLRELTSPLLRGEFTVPEIRSGLPERMLSGAARGAAFTGLIDPRLPGPAPLRGAVYATVEYLLAEQGGVSRMLQRAAPWSRIPGANALVSSLESGEESLVDHLVFGLALALMLGEG